MGVPISRTTLLHRIRADDAESITPVRALGVDDWFVALSQMDLALITDFI
jgi:hypothetical protein